MPVYLICRWGGTDEAKHELRKELLILATLPMINHREWEYGPLWEQRRSELQGKVNGERQKLGTFKEPSIVDTARKSASILIPSLHVHLPLFIPVFLHKEPGTQTDNKGVIQGLAIQLFIIGSYYSSTEI